MAASPLSAPDYLDLADSVPGFSALLAYAYAPMALERGDESRLVLGVRATPGFFSTLGVEPALGRFFAASSEGGPPAAVNEAVLSHLAWRRRFGADPGVVGQTLRLNGQPLHGGRRGPSRVLRSDPRRGARGVGAARSERRLPCAEAARSERRRP